MNKDVIALPKGKILEAADRFQTPFFLYDEKRIRKNCRRFKQAFQKHFSGFQPLYAVKANPNPHVLRIIKTEGFGFDASSLSEAWLAKKLRAKGMYTGNYTLREEFEMAKKAGLILNLDDISLIPTVRKLYKWRRPKTLSFRINPGISKGGMKSLLVAGPDAKYGVPFEKAAQAYRKAKEAVDPVQFGIHMMTGSNVMDEVYFGKVVEKLLEIVASIKKETGIEIEFLNIGGGFGVPYRPTERRFHPEKAAGAVRQAFDRQCRRYQIKEPLLLAEPGRYITADAGWLVSRVTVIKDSYKKFVGVDASSNDMPRPSIYDAYHHVTVLNGSKKQEKVSVVGRICENNDQFAKDRLLPVCKTGDVVAIHNCGAHAYSMGHNYNGHVRHAEYLLRADGTFKKIRRAETLNDLFRTVRW